LRILNSRIHEVEEEGVGRYRAALLIVIGMFACGSTHAQGKVEVTVTPSIQEYCHVVLFPQGWKVREWSPDYPHFLNYVYDQDYEFRIPGLLETTFLVAGYIPIYRAYTTNKYRVDLADPKANARSVTEREWESGTKVRDTRLDDVRRAPIPAQDRPYSFRGFLLDKTGRIWLGAESRLSPDGTWIVLLSMTGEVGHRDESPMPYMTGRDQGKLFFDVFNADTGKKVITIVATYLDVFPDSAIDRAMWVTERYFIVPLGKHRERCLVCDFGRAQDARKEKRIQEFKNP
jgi:hypothetical protein